MLDLRMLDDMPPGTCFATGVTMNPRIYYEGPIRWAAQRGDINDWAIYYHHEHSPLEEVLSNGDKIYQSANIRSLVPCDDDALARYRR